MIIVFSLHWKKTRYHLEIDAEIFTNGNKVYDLH
jgi:hypothetical protein